MIRVPFQFDQKDGVVSVSGVARLDGDDLVLEVSRTALQIVPLGTRRVRIPAAEVEAIEVREGTFSRCLAVRVFEPDLVADFPGGPTDEVTLPLKRKDVGAARALAREVRLRNLPL